MKVTRNVPDAWEYCRKEETRLPGYEPFIHGEKPQMKERGLTEEEKDKLCMEAKAAMKRGAGEDWFEADPKRRKYFRGTGWQVKNDMLRRQMPSPEFQDIELYIYTGGTGLGKTATVGEFLKDQDYYTPPDGAKALGHFWDGYRGQNTVWIDDFDGRAFFRAMIKHWGGYQQRCEVKQSGTIMRAKRWIITADARSRDWRWGESSKESEREVLNDARYAQLERRITIEYEFQAGAINTPPLPPHPAGRQPTPILLRNGLQVHPYTHIANAPVDQALPRVPELVAPPVPAPPPSAPSAEEVVDELLTNGMVPLLQLPEL